MIKISNHELCKNVSIKINGQNGKCNIDKLNSLMKWGVFGIIIQMSKNVELVECKWNWSLAFEDVKLFNINKSLYKSVFEKIQKL